MHDELPSGSARAKRSIPGPRGMDLWRFLLRFGSSPHEHRLVLAAEYGDIVQLAFPV